MAKIVIISLGLAKDKELDNLEKRYLSRLATNIRPELRVIDEEGTKLKLSGREYVIGLDERGAEFDTLKFCDKVGELFQKTEGSIVFLIGNSCGFPVRVRDSFNCSMRLSALTFPHRFARLLLIEQIYRMDSLMRGVNYHH